MDLSVLLSTYRRSHLLGRTLTSFCSLNIPDCEWEIVLIDNAGDQRTKQVADEFSVKLPLKVLLETYPGKNNALNKAIPEAQGDILVFTDDDIIADPNWLIEVFLGAKRWPHHYVFGGRIIPKWPHSQGKSAEHAFLRHAFAIADWDIPEGLYCAGKVFGPNMAVRASIFKDGWRFNPGIGPDGTTNYITGSETELTRRLEKAGFKAVYLPRAVVFHQITLEQMNIKWLYGRTFRKGRWDAYKKGTANVSVICGIPRCLIREVWWAYVLFKISEISGDERLRDERGLAYWYKRGMIYQYRKQRSRNRPLNRPEAVFHWE